MNLDIQEPQPSKPDYRTIPLTQGQFAIVDPEDYDWLMQWKWIAHWSDITKSYYARRTSYCGRKKSLVIMAREIMKAQKGTEVDHRDHSTLDNRKSNLRICPKFKNCANRKTRADNTSGFKGASLIRASGKWKAEICSNGQKIRLGLFGTAEEAGEAYRNAAIKIHGEYAHW